MVFFFEQNAFLQETSEEWEQCERKLKDVRAWIDKTATLLESAPQKKKPLRDQHGLCEKYLADVSIQKTKISMSVEKLQVDFGRGPCGRSLSMMLIATAFVFLYALLWQIGALPSWNWWRHED